MDSEISYAGMLVGKEKAAEIVLEPLVIHQLQKDAPGKDRALILIVRGENHKIAVSVSDLVNRIE